MKQLKFIVDSPPATGMSNFSYQDLLIIPPHSQIAMDKFFMTVPTSTTTSATTNINLPSQIILVNNNVAKLFTDSTVVIPAKIYPTLIDLIQQMNESFNITLDTTQNGSTTADSDTGFAYTTYIDASGTITTGFYRGIVDNLSDYAPTLSNTSIDENNLVITTDNGTYSCISSNSHPVIQGGIYISFTLENVGVSYFLQFGLRNQKKISNELPLGEEFGMRYDGDKWYFFNQTNNEQDIESPLVDGCFIEMYVVGGDLKMSITYPDGDKAYSDSGVFEGFNFNTSYDFFIEGNIDSTDPSEIFEDILYTTPPTATNKYGTYINPLPILPYISQTANSPANTIVKWDWTQAQLLRQGLGFTNSLIYSPNATTYFYGALNDINFVIFYDFALETSSLPLATYEANTTENGQRKNIIAYFTPVATSANTSETFYYDSKHLDFIDLDNEYPISLNTLSFRVLDVNNGTNIIANYMSFNVFIKSPTENIVYAKSI